MRCREEGVWPCLFIYFIWGGGGGGVATPPYQHHKVFLISNIEVLIDKTS